MRRFAWALFVLFSLEVPVAGQTVIVAAASNLSAAEGALQKAFARKNPGMALQFTFGASGALVTQIIHGAPFHAFLSADREFAQKLVDAGLATGPVKTYAVGKLIFLATRPIDPTKGLSVLLDPQVAQFATANPETAPYGRAAFEAMTKAGVYDRAKAKQVTGQNVTQVLQFTLIATGFGFVNKSALQAKDVKPYSQEGKYWFEIDSNLYSPIEQGFVVLKTAEGAAGGRALAAFLGSLEAARIFEEFGYGRP